MELFRTLKAISGRPDGMYPRPLLRLEHLAVLISDGNDDDDDDDEGGAE